VSYRLACLAAALVACFGGEAAAQKAKDTLRASVYQPIDVIDEILSPNPETALLARPVAETLLYYDSDARKVEPLLAASWKWVDDTTLELTLRRDIKFHDGSPFDADDVVHVINYVVDPKETFRFKESRFGWLAGAEKVDAYTVRIRAAATRANALARLTQGPPIYPSDVHGAAASKIDFGRRPVATGPYKVASFDSSGAVLVKHTPYAHGGTRPAARIGRIEVGSIGDGQTHIARLLTGQQDFVYNVELEQARSLSARPDLKMAVTPTISFATISFDVANRSGIGVFKDTRVREAMLRAIDRGALRRALLPKEMQDGPMLSALCHPWVTGCEHSLEPPSYDPARAKRLLAEAGFADGFDLTLGSTTMTKSVAEALAGQLRAVGVRATVDASTIGVWLKKRAEGKFETTITMWDNAGGAPDVEWTTNFFFLGDSSDYYQDPALLTWTHEGASMMDAAKRGAVYRKLFDHVIAEHYAMPVMELPAIIVHHRDLVFEGGHKKPEGFEFHRIRWAN
jgi:peptide/nickel transport system substrate-binding protein